jgi:hypothetical protein
MTSYDWVDAVNPGCTLLLSPDVFDPTMNGHLECVRAHDHVVNSFFPLLSPCTTEDNMPGVADDKSVLESDIKKCAKVVADHAKGKERLTHVLQNKGQGTGLHFAKDLLRSTGPHWPVCHTEIVTDNDCEQIADANLGRSGFQKSRDKERTATGEVYDERVRPVGPALKIPGEVCAFCRTMAGDPYGGAFLECVQDTHSRTTASHRDQCCVKAPCMRRRGWFDWGGIGDAYNHKVHGVAAMFYGNNNKRKMAALFCKSRNEDVPGLMEYLMNFSANSNPYSGPRHLTETNEDYLDSKTNRYDVWAAAWSGNDRTLNDLHNVVALGDQQHDEHQDAHRNIYNVKVAWTDKLTRDKAAKKRMDHEARQRAKRDKSALNHLPGSSVESVDSEEDEDASADNIGTQIMSGRFQKSRDIGTQIIPTEEKDEIVSEAADDDEDEDENKSVNSRNEDEVVVTEMTTKLKESGDGHDDEDEVVVPTNKFTKKRKDRVELDGDIGTQIIPTEEKDEIVSEAADDDEDEDENKSVNSRNEDEVVVTEMTTKLKETGDGDDDEDEVVVPTNKFTKKRKNRVELELEDDEDDIVYPSAARASLGGDENVSPSAAPPLTEAASTRTTTRRIAASNRASNRTSKRKRTERTRFA